MEVKIVKEGKEVNIECKNPKGRHTKKGFKLLTDIVKDGKENLQKLDKYMDYLDEMTAELTGMKIEELDDLDSEEKNKLVSFYQEKIQGKLHFLKSSLKSDSSGEKANPK